MSDLSRLWELADDLRAGRYLDQPLPRGGGRTSQSDADAIEAACRRLGVERSEVATPSEEPDPRDFDEDDNWFHDSDMESR